jgi:hypothetical protein
MKGEFGSRINSYEDLINVKSRLRIEIEEQGNEIKNNPLFKLPASIFKGNSFKSSFKSSVESISLDDYKKTAENILSTILMANKKTRKFFIAFIIAREMIPFTIQKVNELLKK